MDLESILRPMDVQSFKQDYVDRSVMVVNRNSPGFFNSLIDQDYLRNFLLNGGLRTSECRLVKDGECISPYTYTIGRKQRDFSTADENRYIDVSKVLSLYGSGYSISLMGVERHHPSLASLRNKLMVDFGARININLYASPDGSQGLPIHEDYHDVLILQIYGSKHWQVFDAVSPLPFEVANGGGQLGHESKHLIREFVLADGDVAYIPRGIAHKAIALNGPSIHLTVGINWFTYRDLFTEVIHAIADENIEFRKSFSAFRESDIKSTPLAALFEALGKKNLASFVSEALSKLEKKWIDHAIEDHDINIASMDYLIRGFTPSTRLRIKHPDFFRLEIEDGQIVVFYPGSKIEIPKLMANLFMDVIKCGRHSFILSSLRQGALSEAQIEFVKFLVKDGFLQVQDGTAYHVK